MVEWSVLIDVVHRRERLRGRRGRMHELKNQPIKPFISLLLNEP